MDKKMKSQKASLWLAWGLFVLILIEFAALVVVEITGHGMMFDPSQPTPAFAYGLFMLPLNALGFAILGVLVIKHQPENRIGWVSLLYGFGFTLGFVGANFGSSQTELPGRAQLVWLIHVADLSTYLLALFIWLFPDGKFLSKHWRRACFTLLSITLAFAFLTYFWPGQINNLLDEWVDNPFALPVATTPFLDNFIFQADAILGPAFFLVGIISLILRWRRAEGVVRQQMKWLAFFLMTSGVLFISVEVIGESFYPPIFDGWFYLIELSIFWFGLPIVLGLAIFKYRLYDIDIIIQRTLQYSFLTGLLVLIYFGSVVLLQSLVDNITGEQSPMVIVISTLAIAALFNPLRMRTQDIIDRRFYRRKYDAERALAQFAAEARDEVDMEKLTTALMGVVEETLQPEQASLWLKSTRR
jgi:hypothetical protein